MSDRGSLKQPQPESVRDLNEVVCALGREKLIGRLLTKPPEFVAALCAELLLFVAGEGRGVPEAGIAKAMLDRTIGEG